jgi:hypothetical protein
MVVLQTRNYIHEAKMSERNDTQSVYQQSVYQTTVDGTDVYLGFML